MTDKITVISDDLTGACNAASFFAGNKKGINVFIDSNNINKETLESENIYIFNTNTRTINKNKTFKKIYTLGKRLRDFESNFIIKKIDTAYRGNVAVEVDAIMDSLNIDIGFIVNSIPSIDRITIGGFQLSNGKLIEEDDFFDDPVDKVKESFVPEILSKDCRRRVAMINLQNIRRGKKEINKRVADNIEKNNKIIVFDSVIEKDIECIVKALLKKYKSALWVGSLGLIMSVSKERGYFTDRFFRKSKKAKKKIIGFSASTYKTTMRQLEHAKRKDCINIVKVSIDKNSDIGNFCNEFNKIIKKLKREVVDQNFFIIPKVKNDLVAKNIGKKVIEVLSALAAGILKEIDIDRLVLIGGETSFNIMNKLGTKKIEIKAMIEDAVDYGIFTDGRLSGKEFAIKGGSVGNDRTIINMVNY